MRLPVSLIETSRVDSLQTALYSAYNEFSKLPSEINYEKLHKQLVDYKDFFYNELVRKESSALELKDLIAKEPPNKLWKVVRQNGAGTPEQDVSLGYKTADCAGNAAKALNKITNMQVHYIAEYFEGE